MVILTGIFVNQTVAIAQDYIDAEVAHSITNKAEMGYLGDVETDDAAQEVRLYFITATKAKKFKVEKYIFDYDMKFKKMENEQFDRTADVKTKYSWFKFRNEEVETMYGVTLNATLTGRPVFKKKEITNTWSWFRGGYTTTVKTTEVMKPKNSDGDKYMVRAGFENDVNGDLIAVLSPQAKAADVEAGYMSFDILRVNNNLDILGKENFSFEYPQYPIYNGRFQVSGAGDEDLYTGDYVIVFAPLKQPGIKNSDPNPKNYTYVRISPEGKVVEKVVFETKAAKWKIEGVYVDNSGVTLYGPGFEIGKDGDAYGNYKAYPAVHPEKGFDNFQLVSIKGGKVNYVSTPDLAQMEAATVAPAGQKKAQAYEGKRLRVSGIITAPNGDALVTGQMLTKNVNGGTLIYKDFLVLHYGSDGGLKKIYSIDTPSKGGMYNTTDQLSSPATRPSNTDLFLSKDGAGVYWMTGLVTKVDKTTESSYWSGTTTTTYTPREQLLISKIDLKNNSMSEVLTVGDGTQGRKDFFLRKDIRFANMNGGNSLLILGEDRLDLGIFSKNDNFIYLGRLDMK